MRGAGHQGVIEHLVCFVLLTILETCSFFYVWVLPNCTFTREQELLNVCHRTQCVEDKTSAPLIGASFVKQKRLLQLCYFVYDFLADNNICQL